MPKPKSVVNSWIEHDPTLERFNVLVRRKRLAPSTRITYTKNVKCFVDYMEADSPEEALDQIKQLNEDQRTELIDNFVGALLDRGVTTSSILQFVRGGVKKWLTLNEVEVDWTKIQDQILPGEEVTVQDRMPTKQELKQLLNLGSLRDRVMILVLTSSGLRIGALATLTLGDTHMEEETPRIIVERQPGRKISRKMQRHATFITPEAKRMLQQYIEHRRNEGEQIGPDSPILTSDRKEELGNFLNPVYLSNHWRRLLKRGHLGDKNGGPWYDIHLHTLRKYFHTQCTNAGIKTAYREFWMGHLGSHLEDSYFRGQVATHIEEYKKAVPYLTIQTPKEDYEDLIEKVKFLEENGKRKEQQLMELRMKALENAELKTEIQNLKTVLGKLASKIEKIELQQEE